MKNESKLMCIVRNNFNSFKEVNKAIFNCKNANKLRIFIASSIILLGISIKIISPVIMKNIIDEFSGNNQSYLIIILLLSLCFIWILSQIFQHIREILFFSVTENIIRVIALNIFNKFIRMPISSYHQGSSSRLLDLYYKIRNSVPDVIWGVYCLIFPTLIEVLSSSIILFFLYDIFYPLILFLVIAFYCAFGIITINWSVKSQYQAHEAGEATLSHMLDTSLNFENIKYFDNYHHEVNRCDLILKKQETSEYKHKKYMEIVKMGQSLIIGCGFTFITMYSGISVISGKLKIGDFILINGYLLQFVSPLELLGFIIRDVWRGLTSITRALEISNNFVQKGDFIIKNQDVKKVEKIAFNLVSFNYGERKVIHRLTLGVRKGETIAIVGPTGAGKSTIAKLLLRVVYPKHGEIKINDTNINTIPGEEFYKKVGVVPQDIMLFNDSIRYNLLYANLDSSSEEVNKAVELSCLDSFIKKQPKSLDTIIGERSLKISGGEKQRIGIARLFLRMPEICILDEATSALDLHTEAIVMRNIANHLKNSIKIIITHRLTATMHADRIVVLHEGNIVQEGSHQDLLNKKGIYADLWKEQEKS